MTTVELLWLLLPRQLLILLNKNSLSNKIKKITVVIFHSKIKINCIEVKLILILGYYAAPESSPQLGN